MRERFRDREMRWAERPDEPAKNGKGSGIRAETGLTDRLSNSERTGLPFQAMEEVQLHCCSAKLVKMIQRSLRITYDGRSHTM